MNLKGKCIGGLVIDRVPISQKNLAKGDGVSSPCQTMTVKLREFLQNKILWDRERKELHEEIYELQRTEQMWLQHGDVPDSR